MSAQPRPPPPQAAGEEFGLGKGATVGRYVVLGLLGRGGMGEVYAAYDPDLDRKIALKLLRARGGSNDADGRTRLLREAQAIARLSHPNVVVVFDVGTFRESVFIAMEFVEGNTLGYWIEAQNRSWREVLDVYVAAGRGLAAAHAAGLVHRDFKPENVMITKSGQVRVMDFGLAREQGAVADRRSAAQLAADVAEQAAALAEAFESGVDGDATARLGSGDGGGTPSTGSGGYLKLKLTQTGAMLGTPAYMAPEQFAGTGGDARTDQFSFCVALYEGLYRQRPFPGNNALTLMANVVAGTISEPPPEARVPTWIRKILLRGLSTSPEGRFPSTVQQYSTWDGAPQKFMLVQDGSAYRIAMSVDPSKCVDLVGSGSSLANGTRLSINVCAAGDKSQQWSIAADASTGAFVFKNVQAGRCLDEGPNISSGVPMQIWDCNGGNSQKFNVQAY